MKNYYFVKFLLLLFLLAFLSSAFSKPSKPRYSDSRIAIEILSSHETLSKGDTLFGAIKINPAKGWHIYWLNPGDVGQATELKLEISGSHSKEIEPLYPLPKLFIDEGIATYNYYGMQFFPFKFIVPKDFESNRLNLELSAKWLVCKHKCVPGKAKLSITLPVTANKSKKTNHYKLLNKLYSANSFDTLTLKNLTMDEFGIKFPLAEISNKQILQMQFFPLTEGLFDYEKLNFETGSNPNSREYFRLPFAKYTWGDPTQIEGYLSIKTIDSSYILFVIGKTKKED